ncbi:hypothetical protein [Radiobacillus sp. PE A8.2]
MIRKVAKNKKITTARLKELMGVNRVTIKRGKGGTIKRINKGGM